MAAQTASRYTPEGLEPFLDCSSGRSWKLRDGAPMLARETNRRWVIASVAILAIAADGPPAAPDDADPAETHTRIVVIQSEKDGENRPIVALANPTANVDRPGSTDTVQGILARELFRQALLIAARDELGLATRDEVLGDSIPPAAKEAGNVELATVFHSTEGAGEPGRRPYEKQGKYETLFKLRPGGTANRPTAILPSSARSPRRFHANSFPRCSGSSASTGKPNVIRPDAGQPRGTEEKLSHLGFLEPFAAIRDLHRAIRTDGESPERLGALVRGYALAGDPDRAPLASGAQGLQGPRPALRPADGGSRPEGHVRALAPGLCRSLIGLHKNALADIAQARDAAKAGGEPDPPLGRAHRGIRQL